jgi:hypothetical protein
MRANGHPIVAKNQNNYSCTTPMRNNNNTLKDISKDDAKTNGKQFHFMGEFGMTKFHSNMGNVYVKFKQIAKYHSDT